jgi:hypothetical protein
VLHHGKPTPMALRVVSEIGKVHCAFDLLQLDGKDL